MSDSSFGLSRGKGPHRENVVIPKASSQLQSLSTYNLPLDPTKGLSREKDYFVQISPLPMNHHIKSLLRIQSHLLFHLVETKVTNHHRYQKKTFLSNQMHHLVGEFHFARKSLLQTKFLQMILPIWVKIHLVEREM